MRYLILYIILFSLVNSLFAQKDTILLKPIEISTKHNSINQRAIISLDSLEMEELKNNDIARILPLFANINLKTYGQGNLSTSSFRGTSASHTQILWNGIRLNSPMLGQSNFADLPMQMFDKLSIAAGNSSQSIYSGGLGGSIELGNTTSFDKGINSSLLQSFGSFNTYKSYGDIDWSNKKLHFSTKLYHQISDNDFVYKNNTFAKPYPEEKREDADYQLKGFMQQIAYKPKKESLIQFLFWYQENNRSIPSPITVISVPNNENQKSKTLRSAVVWKHMADKYILTARTSFFHENMYYSNIISSIDALHQTTSFTKTIDFQYFFSKKHRISSSVLYTNNFVQSENYNQNVNREEFAANIAFSSTYKKWAYQLKIKQLYTNWEKPIFIPDFSFKWNIIKEKMFFNAAVGKNYHTPNMNDIYWYPGGNINLVPEEGIIADAGIEYHLNLTKHFEIQLNTTVFYAHIDNWILWQADTVFSYWSALNIKEVRSQGIETAIDFKYKKENTYLIAKLMYSFTDAINLSAKSESDASAQKQLIYVPQHSFTSSVIYKYKDFYCSFLYSFQGKRFTTTDNLRYMPWYAITNLGIGKSIHWKTHDMNVSLHCDNIFDIDYQSVAWQPMPGRFFELKLRYKFAKK